MYFGRYVPVMKKFFSLLTVTMLVMAALTFGCIVNAAQPDDIPDIQQTAYDYYDDGYYDDYAAGARPVDWFKVGGGAFLISTIGTIVIVIWIYSGYKFNGQTEPYSYSRKAPLELTGSEDVLIDRQIRRERIERNR